MDSPEEISSPDKSTLRAWLQLLRPPNLFTVPGDPLAGFFLASLAAPNPPELVAVLPCLGASLLIYVSGLLFNDYFDREIDMRERPERPIPSGRVNAKSVLVFAVIAMVSGIGISYVAGLHVFIVAVSLALLVLLYNIKLKHVPHAGPLNMALCRGISVLLGGAVVLYYKSNSMFMTSVLITAYIYIVSEIAYTETSQDKRKRLISRLTGIPFLLALYVYLDADLWPFNLWALMVSAAVMSAAFFYSLHISKRIREAENPVDVQKGVGSLIRGLLLIQAALCALFYWQGLVAAVILVFFFPLSWLTAKRFYAS
ncbi:MAG: UbiA family prenyltransferase [Planctomycetota bacterium]